MPAGQSLKERGSQGSRKVKLSSILIFWIPICLTKYAIIFPLKQRVFIYPFFFKKNLTSQIKTLKLVFVAQLCLDSRIWEADPVLKEALDIHFKNSRSGWHFTTNTLFKTSGPTVNKILQKKNQFYIYYFCCFYVCSLVTHFYWLDGSCLKCLAINLTCLTELPLSNEVVRQIKLD